MLAPTASTAATTSDGTSTGPSGSGRGGAPDVGELSRKVFTSSDAASDVASGRAAAGSPADLALSGWAVTVTLRRRCVRTDQIPARLASTPQSEKFFHSVEVFGRGSPLRRATASPPAQAKRTF